MIIDDFLQPNDWKINKFIWTIVITQITLLGLITLGAFGRGVPILTQIIGFIYLSFIPGTTILRIFKIHKIGRVATILYSTGISLAYAMFLGIIINFLYPYFGINNPISTWSLVWTFTGIQIVLLVLAYKIDRSFSSPRSLDFSSILSWQTLSLTLLPILAALGAEIVNVYHNNILLMVLIPIIALIPVLVAFNKFIPQRLYAWAILLVALALLYQNTLISRYLTGSDIRIEYYLANLVSINSRWNPSISNSYNGMLSIVLLAPIYSKICNLDLTYVFKIIYQLIFSLVPLGIYEVCRRQINAKVAFLSAFFFVSVAPFYETLTSLARQQIAEVFLVLIMLLVVDKIVNPRTKRIFILLFGSALVVSHYGVSYIFMILLIMSSAILFLSDKLFIHGLLTESRDNLSKNLSGPRAKISDYLAKNRTITASFTIFFIVAGLFWYIWESGSTAFTSMVMIGNNIVTGFINEFLKPGASQALSMILTATSPLHEMTKYLQLFMQFLIAIGILGLLIGWKRKKFDEEYSAFSLVAFALAVAAIAVPYLSGALNTIRLYHITLIFLAPFCIIGALTIQGLLRGQKRKPGIALKLLSLVFAVFLLFNIGFVYEVANDSPFSISLSQNSITEHGDAEEKVLFYVNYSTNQDVLCAEWASLFLPQDSKIYATYTDNGGTYALQSYGMVSQDRMYPLTPSTTALQGPSYVYLQSVNVVQGLGTILEQGGGEQVQSFSMGEINPLLTKMDKIYSNGGSEILCNDVN